MDGKETDVARCVLPAIQSYLNMRCLSQKKTILIIEFRFLEKKMIKQVVCWDKPKTEGEFDEYGKYRNL